MEWRGQGLLPKKLNCGLAIIDKRREKPNQAEAMHVIGNVKSKLAIIVDDMVDTGGTLMTAANALLENGAQRVIACASHPVLSGPAVERLTKSNIEKLIVTDTIPLGKEAIECGKIEVVSVAGLLAQAIENIHNESSVSVLFT